MDPERVQFVRGVVKQRFNDLRSGNKIADPINVFVKREPLPMKKIEEERYRLISGVSLVDTLVDRILFGWLNRVSLSKLGQTPCMVGWSPVRGGWILLQQAFLGESVACLDKSAWDWTVQGFLIRIMKNIIQRLAFDAPDWWHKMVDLRFDLLFKAGLPTFSFSDGSMAAQLGDGIMKSGCLLTILLNSMAQVVLHIIAANRINLKGDRYLPKAMGDDTVQKWFPDFEEYVKQLETLGVKVKGVKKRAWIEFCGVCIANNTCIPSYWKKHLFNSQYIDLNLALPSYIAFYANEPEVRTYFQRLALRMAPNGYLSTDEAYSILNSSV